MSADVHPFEAPDHARADLLAPDTPRQRILEDVHRRLNTLDTPEIQVVQIMIAVIQRAHRVGP